MSRCTESGFDSRNVLPTPAFIWLSENFTSFNEISLVTEAILRLHYDGRFLAVLRLSYFNSQAAKQASVSDGVEATGVSVPIICVTTACLCASSLYTTTFTLPIRLGMDCTST